MNSSNNTTKVKKWILPKEINDVADDIEIYAKLRDKYVNSISPFAFKKAVRCSRELKKLSRKFWRMVYKLYPKLKNNRNLIYETENGKGFIFEKITEDT